jgi:hypothetical protein
MSCEGGGFKFLCLSTASHKFGPISRSHRDLVRGFIGTVRVLLLENDDIQATPPSASRLYDTMPVRSLPSPAIDRDGPFPKPRSPGLYGQVRMPAIATLLTSSNGSEIYESCSAAVVSWDGSSIVCVPQTRPRVWSTSEAAIRDHLPVRDAPISTRSDAILLVNAVKGTCALSDPHSRAFPPEVRREIDLLFSTLTKR